MEPLDASAGLRERLARLKMASKRRAARAGGVGVSNEPTDENRFVPSETRSKPFALTEDVRAAPATSSRDRLEALRASRSAARPAAGEGAVDGTRPPADRPPRAFAASTERRSDGISEHRKNVDAGDGDAASHSPPPATVAILRLVPAEDHIGTFATVTRTKSGGVEFVTTRPKTTIRKTRRFDAAVDVCPPNADEATNANDSASSAAATLASNENGFGLARDARAAVRDGVGSAYVFFGNRAFVSRVARGGSLALTNGRRPGDDLLGVSGTDRFGFTGLVAEALFTEIDLVRLETRERVEFVVTLQVLADVIVAPRGAETSKSANGNAKTREVLRDALAGGFDDITATSDSDASTTSEVRGGRGAGAASAAAAYFQSDASRPVIPRVREDAYANLFFAENAVEAVIGNVETCRACLKLAFSKLTRWEAETRANEGASVSSSGERLHSLVRFDVRARRFAEDGDAARVSTAADDENRQSPISETRASVYVCDFDCSRPRSDVVTKGANQKKNESDRPGGCREEGVLPRRRRRAGRREPRSGPGLERHQTARRRASRKLETEMRVRRARRRLLKRRERRHRRV
jgi:hypothetical protein